MVATTNITNGERIGGAFLPFGIMVIIAMMVLPLPVVLLDLFFVFNILLSLLVLMVAMHSYRPLDFTSFPSILLIATVLRLALNVASTRIVLSQGHNGEGAAGKVIEAFGEFVIAGNFAVGILSLPSSLSSTWSLSPKGLAASQKYRRALPLMLCLANKWRSMRT